jgi:hypothetical protein
MSDGGAWWLLAAHGALTAINFWLWRMAWRLDRRAQAAVDRLAATRAEIERLLVLAAGLAADEERENG